jgi:serine/threonine-protein kinase
MAEQQPLPTLHPAPSPEGQPLETVDFRPGASSALAETATAARPGRRPAPEGDLQPLLWRRLTFLCCIALFGYGVTTLTRLLRIRAVWADPPARGLFLVHAGAALLGLVGLVLLLFSRRRPVRVLRLLEFYAVGVAAAHAALETQLLVVRDTWVQAEGNSPALATLLPWYVIITLYGVLIPNTTRRAAVVVGVLVLAGAGSLLLAWSRHDVPAGQWSGWVINLVVYLGVAAGLTVFNSGLVDAYRRAARELGPYRLVRKLGTGGMGEVFLGEHRLLKRPCAVKLIRPEKAGDDTFVRRFEREVQAATRLTHPAAVQVYDYGVTDDGTFYYAMEYLPGLTLDDVVARGGPLPPGRAVHVLRQLCGALEEAHRMGLVHRDVKPGNVMLCRLGRRADVAKLLDFGLVVEAGGVDTRITQTGSLLGTPAYMSPEQARGAEVGPASDLYSLGTLGYFLVTGRPPFVGKNALGTLQAHLHTPAVRPSQVEPAVAADLEAVLLRLLAKDPGDRYPDAAAAEAALGACACAGEWTEADGNAWWSSVEANQAAKAPA